MEQSGNALSDKGYAIIQDIPQLISIVKIKTISTYYVHLV